MKSQDNSALATLETAFIFPAIIIIGTYVIVKASFLGIKEAEEEVPDRPKKIVWWLSSFFWILVAIYFGRNVFYEQQKFVYACPNDNSSKCYLLRAEADEEVGYTTLFFENGGKVTFEYCDKGSRPTCYEEGDRGRGWVIDFSHNEWGKKF